MNTILNTILNTINDVIKEIGLDKFMKNLVECEDGVDWYAMNLKEIAQEFLAYDIDPVMFCY